LIGGIDDRRPVGQDPPRDRGSGAPASVCDCVRLPGRQRCQPIGGGSDQQAAL
jgi:hypothetical protein